MRALNPKRAMFEGRVVARWEEDDPDPEGWKIRRITIDDADRSQTFVIPSPAYRRVALDDSVRVTVDPRSGRLVDLTITQRPKPLPPDPDPALPASLPIVVILQSI